ncbi:hypothetical protein PR202_gb08855 [Eleusine coracana subsp. coracana]|uniref:Terpene synthase metal-binding domain-containing protein n=1 Tax=Eleusine coracana subsp. coracana TaxID=191504 RepID=A0AAV5EGJ8_ELECO|nr:hypothetical protein PR202_gb08855 [Eleusine coracana subsp. coracana]
MSKLENRIREKLLGDPEKQPFSYDTAWVAMVPAQGAASAPRFLKFMEWIMQNQNDDGSWGDRFFDPASLGKDALSFTLACIIALKKWSNADGNIRKGLQFIGSNLSYIADETCDTPLGFNIIFPGIIRFGLDFGLEFPMRQFDVDGLFQLWKMELQRSWLQKEKKLVMDMETCAMAFRILYVFSNFSEESRFHDSVQGHLNGTKTLVELYKSSQIKIYEDEPTVENIGSWSGHVTKLKTFWQWPLDISIPPNPFTRKNTSASKGGKHMKKSCFAPNTWRFYFALFTTRPWLNYLRANMTEVKWTRTMCVPILEEYMSAAEVSMALGPIITMSLYLMGPKISEDVIKKQEEYKELLKVTSTCCRLLNDLHTYKKESDQGYVNSVLIHAHRYGGSSATSLTAIEAAEKEIKNAIVASERELLRLVLKEGGSIPRQCKDIFWNTYKVSYLFYLEGDGFCSMQKLVAAADAVIYEPLQVTLPSV